MAKYRPSNGTEGGIFMDSFCHQCRRETKFRETEDGEDSCPIARATFIYDADDTRYPSEWQYDEDGNPTCTAFEAEANTA